MIAKYPCEFDIPHRGYDWLDWTLEKAYHPTVDLNKGVGNQDLGNPVVASFKSVIHYIAPIGKNNGGFGNFIVIYSAAYGVFMRLAHLQTVLVKQGDKLELGQKIATVGSTGNSDYAHLHPEMWDKKLNDIIEPKKYLFYPVGKSKQWVQDHYIHPLRFIDDLNSADNWQKKAEEEVTKLGLLKDVKGYVADPTAHKQIQLGLNIYNDLLARVEKLEDKIKGD